MTSLKIKPLDGIIYLQIEEAKAGVLDTSSRSTAVEFATVIATGKGVDFVKRGDKVFVKSWGIDCITHEGKKYFFVSDKTHAILSIVD